MRDTEAIIEAADNLCDLLAPNADMFDDTMRTLSCNEAEALVALFRATGHAGAADMLLQAHADYDEPEDSHYQAS